MLFLDHVDHRLEQACLLLGLPQLHFQFLDALLRRPADLEQAARMVAQAVHIYNHERPHLALKYKTPDAVHRALGD